LPVADRNATGNAPAAVEPSDSQQAT